MERVRAGLLFHLDYIIPVELIALSAAVHWFGVLRVMFKVSIGVHIKEANYWKCQ